MWEHDSWRQEKLVYSLCALIRKHARIKTTVIGDPNDSGATELCQQVGILLHSVVTLWFHFM